MRLIHTQPESVAGAAAIIGICLASMHRGAVCLDDDHEIEVATAGQRALEALDRMGRARS